MQRVQLKMGGEPDKTYGVTLRVRGLVEGIDYIEGHQIATNVYWGGRSLNKYITWSSYSLTIESPPNTYFLNYFQELSPTNSILDYTTTFKIQGDSAVALELNSNSFSTPDGIQYSNNIEQIVPGEGLIEQPHNGQFLQINVVAVELIP